LTIIADLKIGAEKENKTNSRFWQL